MSANLCAALCCAVPQATHSSLLEQVQQLEVLRKENGEMAQLVAQLQVLKNDQQHLQELCDQVDALRGDNAALQRKSQALPSLQAENERLKVRRAVLGARARRSGSTHVPCEARKGCGSVIRLTMP